ncbi:MAG: DUF3795 domain-containing protein [Proteobacteria bacterium]|nr:DUF3795 domain-containing protein [Pseudomonadota bacterium]MBU1582274.1 DUF3795 domain-containing protein [Pseudomonadota bacterium]MBU2455090.1 DUF3795 domain-containing protein [Pseudomonadota bacterium]MBU2628193.1 DUF3795 domain-containing protein [Pseudomonadota bacterium]
MNTIKTDINLVAKCGLYCGSCGKFQKGNCRGCLENKKASWCKVRTCCLEKNIASCADCNEFDDVMACKKYNNFMAKLFGFVFNSDRAACIDEIKEKGHEQFATQMAQNRIMTFKRKARIF